MTDTRLGHLRANTKKGPPFVVHLDIHGVEYKTHFLLLTNNTPMLSLHLGLFVFLLDNERQSPQYWILDATPTPLRHYF